MGDSLFTSNLNSLAGFLPPELADSLSAINTEDTHLRFDGDSVTGLQINGRAFYEHPLIPFVDQQVAAFLQRPARYLQELAPVVNPHLLSNRLINDIFHHYEGTSISASPAADHPGSASRRSICPASNRSNSAGPIVGSSSIPWAVSSSRVRATNAG